MHYYLLFLCSPFGSRGWAGSQPQSPSWTTRDCCRHVVTAFLYATHSLFKLFGSKYHLYGQKIYIFKIKKGKKNIKTKGKIKSKSFFHTWQISIYTWLCVSWKHRQLIGRKLWPVLFVNMLTVSERPEFCSVHFRLCLHAVVPRRFAFSISRVLSGAHVQAGWHGASTRKASLLFPSRRRATVPALAPAARMRLSK